MLNKIIDKNNFRMAELLFENWLTSKELLNLLSTEKKWSKPKFYRILELFKKNKIISAKTDENYETKFHLNEGGLRIFLNYYNKEILPSLRFKNFNEIEKKLNSLKKYKGKLLHEDKLKELNIPFLLMQEKVFKKKLFSNVLKVQYKVDKQELEDALKNIKKLKEETKKNATK